jgi:hypothetical protein
MAMRCFVAAGWSDQHELTVGEAGAQRIHDAVAGWEAMKSQPELETNVYACPTAQPAAPEESPRHPQLPRCASTRRVRGVPDNYIWLQCRTFDDALTCS